MSKKPWEPTDDDIAQAMRNGCVWYPIVSTADRKIVKVTIASVVKYLRKHNRLTDGLMVHPDIWQALRQEEGAMTSSFQQKDSEGMSLRGDTIAILYDSFKDIVVDFSQVDLGKIADNIVALLRKGGMEG